MDRLILPFALLSAIAVIGIFAVNLTLIKTNDIAIPETTFSAIPEEIPNYHSSLNYGSKVCIYKNGVLVNCDHNVITNNGLNLVRAALGQGHKVIVNHLALGNTTAPAAGSTSHPGLISACGLASADGTYWAESQNGNWTTGYTWTSSCTITVNTTGLYNDTNAGTYFAGTTFTSVNLNNNDQLTVNYTSWIQ